MNDYGGPVREYLDYCRSAWKQMRGQLDGRYHPTADGACRLIWHRTPAEAQEIRQAYREATTPPAPRLSQDRDNSKQRGEDRWT